MSLADGNRAESRASGDCSRRLLDMPVLSGEDARTPGWERDALAGFALQVGDDAFPCLFARKAWNSNTMRFAFIAGTGQEKIDGFIETLSAYTDFVHSVPSEERLMTPLVTFFNAYPRGPAGTLHALGWDILNEAHRRDPAPWPGSVPLSPDHPDWCFCFNGVQLFVNMSSPEHRVLRNRNLGQYLTFVINPRENFDIVASLSNRSGRLVRNNIRSRVAAWNGGVIPPELGFYGEEDNREWTQYQLHEDAVPRPSKCPFRSRAGLHSSLPAGRHPIHDVNRPADEVRQADTVSSSLESIDEQSEFTNARPAGNDRCNDHNGNSRLFCT